MLLLLCWWIFPDLTLILEPALSVAAYMFPWTFAYCLSAGDRYGSKNYQHSRFWHAIFSCLGALAFNITSWQQSSCKRSPSRILPTISYVGSFLKSRNKDECYWQCYGNVFLGAAAARLLGGLSFIGSWRLVYLVYGIAELIIAILMLKYLAFTRSTAKSIGSAKLMPTHFHSLFSKNSCIAFLVGIAVFTVYLPGDFWWKNKVEYFIYRPAHDALWVGYYIGGQEAGNIRRNWALK